MIDSDPALALRPEVRLSAAALLAALILWLDALAAPDIAASGLYALVILLACPASRRTMLISVGGCLVLAIVGLVAGHGWPPPAAASQRTLVGVVAILAATVLAMRNVRAPIIERLERTRIELERALRDATIGAASASIAHELNQPLAAMTSYADAARRWMDRVPPDIDEARSALQNAACAAQLARDVVRRLRSLYGKTASEDVPVPIDAMVREATRLIRADLTQHDVRLGTELRAPNVVINGDRILLQQTVLNLMNNAVQAMTQIQGRERSLRVSTSVTNGEVTIRVDDSGDGFTPQGKAHAFDAFFTTKPSGMGLGLAISRSAIQAHDGRIEIGGHDAGPGASVRIILPLAN